MKLNQVVVIMEPSPLDGVSDRVAAISFRLGQVGAPCVVSNILDVKHILKQSGKFRNGQEVGGLILASASDSWLSSILELNPTFPILAVISGRGNFGEEHRIFAISLEHKNLQIILDCSDYETARRRGLPWMLNPKTYQHLAVETEPELQPT